MKVGFNVSKVVSAYNQNSKIEKTNEIKKKVNDRIEISKEGKELSKYVELAKNAEVENPRVDEIKKLINMGNYNIDSKELAKAMLEYKKGRDV